MNSRLSSFTATAIACIGLAGCAVSAEPPEQGPVAARQQAIEDKKNPNDMGPNGCSKGGSAATWGCCGSDKTPGNEDGCKICSFACYLHDWACENCSAFFCGEDCVPGITGGSRGPNSDGMQPGASTGNFADVPTSGLGSGFTPGVAAPDHCKWSSMEGAYAEAHIVTMSPGPQREDFVASLGVHGQSVADPSGREAYSFAKGNMSGLVVIAGSQVLLVSSEGVANNQLQAFSFAAVEPVAF